MTGTYALVKNGVVLNTILWDGPEITPVKFEKGVTYEEIPDSKGNYPSSGWLFDGETYSSSPLTTEEQLANQQLAITANLALKQSLLDEATQRRDTLQDAVDEGIATESEATALSLWKKISRSVRPYRCQYRR